MIKMQMRQQHIGNVIPAKAMHSQGLIQGIIPMQVIMTEKFGILLVADAIVHQDQPPAILDQQATHSPGAEIVVIGRMDLAP
jgi:hypothetical protein